MPGRCQAPRSRTNVVSFASGSTREVFQFQTGKADKVTLRKTLQIFLKSATVLTVFDSLPESHLYLIIISWRIMSASSCCIRACLQTHHGPAPLLDPALSESRVRATLQTRPSIIRSRSLVEVKLPGQRRGFPRDLLLLSHRKHLDTRLSKHRLRDQSGLLDYFSEGLGIGAVTVLPVYRNAAGCRGIGDERSPGCIDARQTMHH